MTRDDNPHESDGTHPEACTYCGDAWPCESFVAIAELEAEVATLRCIVRYVAGSSSLLSDVAIDLDDECAAAVHRATEEAP